MEFHNYRNLSDSDSDSVNLREILDTYLVKWKWFLGSVIFFILLSIFKFWYAVPNYSAQASVIIREKERDESFSTLNTYEDLGFIGLAENSLENEIQILGSNKLMTDVVRELNLNIEFFVEGIPHNTQIFPNLPISISIVTDSLLIERIGKDFYVKILSQNRFELAGSDDRKVAHDFGSQFEYNLGNDEIQNIQTIEIDCHGRLPEELIGETILVKVIPLKNAVSAYVSRLEIEPVNERFSNVLLISISDPVRDKAVMVINNLVQQFNLDAISERKRSIQSTIDFLDSRINLISTELGAIESTAEQFRSKKGYVGTESGTNMFLQSSAANERQLISANTEKEVLSYILQEMGSLTNEELLPINIGLTDRSIVNLITEYNELVLRRNRVSQSSSSLNPIVVNIDSQISDIKNNLIQTLRNNLSSLEIEIKNLNQQRGQISSKIARVPVNEREYKDIVRELDIKNDLYLFLLQKKEEAIVSGAAQTEKARIINEPQSIGKPVSPDLKLYLLGAISLGFLFPFTVVYLSNLLDTKVRNRQHLDKYGLPYLGDIPLVTGPKLSTIKRSDNSKIAEAFRYIRTNIGFMLNEGSQGKTIFVTSTKSGEGKTFTSINLAFSLAIAECKTLLITLDLRHPKFKRYLDLKLEIGLTNFIKDSSVGIHDIVQTHPDLSSLDIIDSGDIPPNPVEILMNKRLRDIIDFGKENYDYIIIDTAPVGMVTDTIQIGKFSDLTLYVVKANYLDRRSLIIPSKLYSERKLGNMAFVLNGYQDNKNTYGYSYGYGGQERKSFISRLKDVFVL